jgi:gentisate 1,2-dioxygenase
MATQTDTSTPAADLQEVIAELERMNVEAAERHLWIRTRWNLPNQKPWHLGEAGAPTRQPNNLPLEHIRPVPHVWRWVDIEKYLMTLMRLCPLELTERQSVLLTNPAYGTHGIKVTNTIRIAISIYKTGDVARPHLHTPNASRTIISNGGGYTVVEGERIETKRGDVVFTPNGTWHGHGNLDEEPVIWADTLDWPLMDYLGCVAVRHDDEDANMGGAPESDFSRRFYGRGGIRPAFSPVNRGIGQNVTPKFLYGGGDIRGALADMAGHQGDPYDGVQIELVNPMTGGSVFPTLSYRAQLLRSGQTTAPFRQAASQLYFVLEGEGHTEVNGERLTWQKNDFVIVPGHDWRSHTVTGGGDAILYSVTDAPVMEALGMYRAQGKLPSGRVVEI